MAVYATQAQLRRRIPKAAIDGDTNAELDEILGAVSRLIDREFKGGDDYFAPAGDPSARIVYGAGNSFLTLPHYVWGSVAITAPAGFTVPNFLIDRLRAVSLRDDGTRSQLVVWQSGVPFTITGNWGFVETPADIREACLQTAVRWWRGRDDAFSGVIGGINKDGNIIERDLPAPVRHILDNWRRKLKAPYIA